MNKAAIKNFAGWARKKLIAEITEKAGRLGMTENTASFDSRVEDAAYIWFKRLITVRFMEVNDFLPCGVRVLSSKNHTSLEPDIVAAPFTADLVYDPDETEQIVQLKKGNQGDALFRMLLIKQCHELKAILPEYFQKTEDKPEPDADLLSPELSYSDKEGIVCHLVRDITEDDFREGVEVIGWLYQYYNDERKKAVISIYKGFVKKEDIPAATQLFTPDWIVRYMVDNSLGRYWIERNPESGLRQKLDFFIDSEEKEAAGFKEKIDPEGLTFLDPCMGSGHILVYAFDVMMAIYRECGYSDPDAALGILKNNLFGLDIDERAYRLAYFALMMQARKYCPGLFELNIIPNICVIQDSNMLTPLDTGVADGHNHNVREAMTASDDYLPGVFTYAKEIGSLLMVEAREYPKYHDPLRQKLARQADIMSRKYAVVCTNPPYMNKFQGHLKDYVIAHYKPYSGDLFAVYMYRNFNYCLPGGYLAFMTPFVWMFIQTYAELRRYILENKAIISLIQLEYSAYEDATVPICTFVLKNEKATRKGGYIKLTDFKGGMEVQKNNVLAALKDNDCGYFYQADASDFMKIPGMPIAYWVSDRIREVFSGYEKLGDRYTVKQGMATGNNDRFLRLWFEVDRRKIGFNISGLDEARQSRKKWFPYNKGGDFRYWYGNNVYVVNWENDGAEIKEYTSHLPQGTWVRLKSRKYYFKESITWSFVSSSYFGVRYSPTGCIFDVAGSSLFAGADAGYILAFLTSKVAFRLLQVINPTLNYQIKDVKSLPLIVDRDKKPVIEALAAKCITLSRRDWDAFETSWDFIQHPFLLFRVQEASDLTKENAGTGSWRISDAYTAWSKFAKMQFDEMTSYHEELNRLFIAIYGLQGEMNPEITEKDVTIRRADLGRDVRSFLSYAVGCLFGRYSYQTESERMLTVSNVSTAENILFLTDETYFEDDIVGLFCGFLEEAFGPEYLEENLDFIAGGLGSRSRRSGNAFSRNSRDVIRRYFLKNFFGDHCKKYQKRPIYWLCDSGRNNGFKALIAMHRYDADTFGTLHRNYLQRLQGVYEKEITVAVTPKRKNKLIKQLNEVRGYDDKITQLAAARIPIDLDDGVIYNYEKVQTGKDGIKQDVLKQFH